jgi:hypothetical protein
MVKVEERVVDVRRVTMITYSWLRRQGPSGGGECLVGSCAGGRSVDGAVFGVSNGNSV